MKITPVVAESILTSEVYQKIQNHIAKDEIIDMKSELWNELEGVVAWSSPQFVHNLHVITGGRLSIIEFRTALLIRCGIAPSQMAMLFGKTIGAIGSRRKSISSKIFNKELSMAKIDAVIRML